MPQISPFDVTRHASSSNPLIRRAVQTLLERLKNALSRHKHITFTNWASHTKNTADTRLRRFIITVFISELPDPQEPIPPDPPFLVLLLSVKETGTVSYMITPSKDMTPETIKAPETIPTIKLDAIDPINQPADAAGFTAHVLEAIQTTIAPLPERNGYFI